MSVVVVKMNFCEKTTKITAKLRDDGDIDIHIASDCDNVKDYAKKLGNVLTLADISNFAGSRVFDNEISEPLTATCLTRNGIINAAWLETGMLSKSRAKKVGKNEVIFQEV